MSAEAARAPVEFLSLPHPQVRDACLVALEHDRSIAIVAVRPGEAIDLASPCLVSPSIIEDAVRNRATAPPEDLDPDVFGLVERAATNAIVRTIRMLGFLRQAGDTADIERIERTAGVPARFRRVLIAWLDALTEDGLLQQSTPGQWSTQSGLPDVEADWQPVEAAAGANIALVDYLKRSADDLVSLLRGERDPIGLLFPSANTDIAEQLYKSNAISAYLNGMAAAAVRELADHHMGALRVLELGAGIGGTTDSLMPPLASRPVGYYFTDVSSFLVARARRRYASYPWMRYQLLDLNGDLPAQGVEPSSMHLVVAANVLHYANNAREGLEAVRRVLVPGGYLVAIESTRQARWQLISLAFLDGLAVSDERATAAMPLLPPGRWQSLLAETGFEMVSIHPDPASPFAWIGGHVLVARVPPAPVSEQSSPALWDLLHETIPPARMPDRVLVRSDLPRLADGSIDTSELDRAFGAGRPGTGVEPATDLERSIAAVFATILNQSTISVQENFFDLGADSLTAARACEALQHVVHKRIDVVDLLTHPNIRSLAAHLSTTEVDATSSLAGERARKRLALMASRRRPSREEHQA